MAENSQAAPRVRPDDYGTALDQIRPWLRTIDGLAEASRALVLGTGTKAELAQKLEDYEAAGRRVIKEVD